MAPVVAAASEFSSMVLRELQTPTPNETFMDKLRREADIEQLRREVPSKAEFDALSSAVHNGVPTRAEFNALSGQLESEVAKKEELRDLEAAFRQELVGMDDFDALHNVVVENMLTKEHLAAFGAFANRSRKASGGPEEAQRLLEQLSPPLRPEDMPVAPNLLRDTKRFDSLWSLDGAASIRQAGAWSGFEWAAGAELPEGTLTDLDRCSTRVADLTALAEAQAWGLFPFGELGAFLTSFGTTVGHGDASRLHGGDVRAVVLEVTISAKSRRYNNSRVYTLCQQTPEFTSFGKGRASTQVGVFAKVLERTGSIKLHLFGNRGAGVVVPSRRPRTEWLYYHNSRRGYGGMETSYFEGVGHMKVALALPYVSSGNHGSVPVWAGFQSNYYADDDGPPPEGPPVLRHAMLD